MLIKPKFGSFSNALLRLLQLIGPVSRVRRLALRGVAEIKNSSKSSRKVLHAGRHRVVEDVQLEVGDSHPVALVVVDVLGPGAALNVKQLTELRIVELNGHKRAFVVLLRSEP